MNGPGRLLLSSILTTVMSNPDSRLQDCKALTTSAVVPTAQKVNHRTNREEGQAKEAPKKGPRLTLTVLHNLIESTAEALSQ